jgi:Two component regulator propeller
MTRNIFLSLFLTLASLYQTNAQNLAIGQWREHLPYNRGKILADAGSRIFCATEDGLFAYQKTEGSLERFTRLNGLHDFGISSISYDNTNNALIVGFSNANIDIIYDNNTIYNIPFIKEKNITGSKNINNIYINNGISYLACGFGIVVLDAQRQEIKDSYFIGAGGTQLNVLDITSDGNYLYAATDSGVFSGNLLSNLADFNNWNKILDDNNNSGDYNKIIFFGGKIYVNYAKPDAQLTSSDELWVYDAGTWSQISIPELPQQPKRYSMRIINNNLIVANDNSVSVFNAQLQRIAYFDNTLYSNPQIRDGWIENGNITWIADKKLGLIRIENADVKTITPSGPASPFVAEIQITDNVLWVIHGPKSISWNPQDYPIDGFSRFTDGSWKTFNNINYPQMGANSFFANMSASIVPNEPQHLFVGSAVNGILEFNNDAITTFYSKNNSTLTPPTNNPTQTIVHGIMHDEDGNLWVANSGIPNAFHVLKKDGVWKTFNMQGVVNGAPFAGYIAIDRSNYKWINIYGGTGTTTSGLAVLDDGGTLDTESDDRKRFIETSVYPRCMAVDNDGQLWVGTDEGPQVIYSPSAVFDETTTLQKILISQDNTFQYLLENEVITYIAIDGANRKWIGTQNSGIYLLSPDGQSELQHFTIENSPIFSNTITCIGINKKSGEVFIGTDKGMISYQSDAVEGTDQCESVIVYPNPVQPLYNGPIAIRGVINNSKVKITDINGGLIYEGTALGGQAIWNGRNFKGEKASTGVYLVFASDEDGTNGCITKLLFLN